MLCSGFMLASLLRNIRQKDASQAFAPVCKFLFTVMILLTAVVHNFLLEYHSSVLSYFLDVKNCLHHLILPAFTLSLMSFANIALHTRQKLIDILNSEYCLFARARGEGKWTILRRHGLRNILLPALTLQFTSFAELFGGSVMAENVFSYPGLGSAVSAAGLRCDVPLLLGVTLFSALFVCVGNMIANLLYGIVDPQIREVSQ
jgi:peptide/nickel transport system permease protein